MALLATLMRVTAFAQPAAETPRQAAGTPAPAVAPTISVTPTIDRLAAPPTVVPPTQADDGAQLYWLHCQPCHGDRGQGLTDEWRAQYPPEDQNCWASGCHGNSPYPNGFILPTAVPPVTGEGSLERFDTMGRVYNFIRVAMPLHRPGYLQDEEYLAITAFLARAHKVWDGTPLDESNVESFRLKPAAVESEGQGQKLADEAVEGGRNTSASDNEAHAQQTADAPAGTIVWISGVILLFTIIGGAWLWRQKRP